MNSITQDMKYRQSLIHCAKKHGIGRARRKYNKYLSYIYFWHSRYNGRIGQAIGRIAQALRTNVTTQVLVNVSYL